jgi:hypothetical protein
MYSAVHGSWPVEELEELADGPTGCVQWLGVGVYLLETAVDKVNCRPTYGGGEKD